MSNRWAIYQGIDQLRRVIFSRYVGYADLTSNKFSNGRGEEQLQATQLCSFISQSGRYIQMLLAISQLRHSQLRFVGSMKGKGLRHYFCSDNSKNFVGSARKLNEIQIWLTLPNVGTIRIFWNKFYWTFFSPTSTHF